MLVRVSIIRVPRLDLLGPCVLTNDFEQEKKALVVEMKLNVYGKLLKRMQWL